MRASMGTCRSVAGSIFTMAPAALVMVELRIAATDGAMALGR